MNIIYKIGTATEKEIFNHLFACDDNFIPLLSSRINLRDFSKKISEKAVKFEAWSNGDVVGMVNAYFNDTDNSIGYITNVSMVKNYTGVGIASKLMQMCLDYAGEHHFNEIRLEVHKKNSNAIKLYEKFRFEIFENNEEFIIMKCVIR